jgi:succinyl-CoA synthetase beta subunit
VEMDGNVGVIGNGAGLNMATLDILLYYGGEPANFLEVSGRTYHKAAEAIDIVLSNPGVKVVFGNFFGCISRCDVIAEGLADAYREGVINVPMVVAMRGTGGSQGRETLKEAGLTEIFKDDIEAGKRLAEILKER